LNTLLGVELMCAAQGIEFRAPLTTSQTLQDCMKLIRSVVPKIEQDRYMATDMTASAKLVADGSLIEIANLQFYVTGSAV
ncbi:MAG: histidine ammonia-lyase, partial [Rhizobiaceae bacterium]